MPDCTGLCSRRLRQAPERLGFHSRNGAVEDDDDDDDDDGCESEHGSEGSDYVDTESSTDESGDDDCRAGDERNGSTRGGRSKNDESFAGEWARGGGPPITGIGPCGPTATHGTANDEAFKEAMDSEVFDPDQSGHTSTGHLILCGTLDGLDRAFARLLGADGSRTSEGHTVGDIVRELLSMAELELNSSVHGLPPNMKKHHNVGMYFDGFYGKHRTNAKKGGAEAQGDGGGGGLGESDVFVVEAAKRGERGLAKVYTHEDELPAAGDAQQTKRMSFVPVPEPFVHPQTSEPQQVHLSRISQARPVLRPRDPKAKPLSV